MKKTEKEEADYLGLKLLEIINRKTCLALGKEDQDASALDPVLSCEHGKTLRKSTWRKLMFLEG